MEYIVYCDESNSNGPKFSDFFGGCIVSGKDWHLVEDTLEAKKKELNLFGELKWTKVTAQYLERYIEIVDLFLIFSRMGRSKFALCFGAIRISRPVRLCAIVTTSISSYTISF